MTNETLANKKSLGARIKDWFKNLGTKIKTKWNEFAEACKNGWKATCSGLKFFKNNPKQGMKNTGKFLKTQNGWLFVLPAVILMIVFTFWPILNSLILAFKQDSSNIDVLQQASVGWGNFKYVLTRQIESYNFLTCLLNTFVLALISVPLSIMLALLISVALNSIKAVQKAYQTIFFLPYLTNALAMGAVFATFFKVVGTTSQAETYGLFNNFLSMFGVKPYDWLEGGEIFKFVYDSDVGTAGHFTFNTAAFGPWAANIFVTIVYEVWSGLPFKILILFSALQSVNKQYYDAAKVDCANRVRTLTHVTVPLISPMLSYLFMTGIIGAMKSYSPIVGIFGADMNKGKMGTIVGYIYACIDHDAAGYAAAGCLILFIIIMILTAISNQVSKKRVHY